MVNLTIADFLTLINQSKNEISGIVKMLKTVPSSTELAALSWPLPISSDKLRTTEAIGQLQSITIDFSITGSRGKKSVIAITIRGIIICFETTDIYGVSEVKIDENFTVANLIPKTNIHIGVLIVTNISKTVEIGAVKRIPKINSGMAKYEATIAGFKKMRFRDIYLGSLDIARHPSVKPIRFIEIEKTAAYTMASG